MSDLGLAGSLVVRKRLDDRAAGTILTLMLLMGALTAALIAATAPLVADIFDEPQLAPVLAVLAIGVLLECANVVLLDDPSARARIQAALQMPAGAEPDLCRRGSFNRGGGR